MSNEKEITRAVNIIKKYSKKKLYLLHCISLYPTPQCTGSKIYEYITEKIQM